MRILIDAANCTVGGGAAARHLLRALDNIDADIEVIALAPAGEAFHIRPRRLRLLQLPAKSSSQWWTDQPVSSGDARDRVARSASVFRDSCHPASGITARHRGRLLFGGGPATAG